MARTIDQIYGSLNGLYDPERTAINAQKAALPQQQAADISGLDTAKTNAFGDITNQANARGMVYSGAPIAEEQRYVGETYLPKMAQLKTNYLNQGSALEQALANVGQRQQAQASGMYNDELSADRAAAASNPGLDLSGLFGGGGAPPAQAQAPNIHDELAADLQRWLPSDYATRYAAGYTERTLIPKLQQLYPELRDQIPALVYQYRKQYEQPAPAPTKAAAKPSYSAWTNPLR